MKRVLPTAHAREHERRSRSVHPSPAPQSEREPLAGNVIAIAQATTGRAAMDFAAEVVRALIAEGEAVTALVATEDAAADAQAAMSLLMEAGAQATAWVRVPHEARKPELASALERFATQGAWVVVLGNVLPLYYRPLLCVLISAPRSTHLPDAARLAAFADLQATAPSSSLATEVARLTRARALVRSGANG